MANGITRWIVLFWGAMLANSPCLYAGERPPAAVYGTVPGSWTHNEKGFADKFVPAPGYGKGVYAVQGLHANVVLALDTDGEGFAECRKISGGEGTAQPIPNPACGPAGPACTAYPYQCSSELSRPLFIETDIRPTASERLHWTDSSRPSPAFRPLVSPAKGAKPFYFERSCRPKAFAGRVLFHGAWLAGPEEFRPGPDESVPASIYEHYGRALYFREASGIKFLSEPSITLGEASAFEPVPRGSYQWEGEPESAPRHAQPQYYAIHKLYTVQGGYWLEIDWQADFEGAGVSMNTLILRVQNGKVSEFASAQQVKMY